MNQNRKRLILLIVISVGVALALYLVLRPLPAAKGRGVMAGEQAPAFTLLSTNGKQVKLSDFQGEAVILNFWATWCVPCRTEMPALEAAYQQYSKDGLAVVGVNIRESAVAVQAFGSRYGLTFPLLLDPDGAVTDQYDILPLPTTYFIDISGKVRRRYEGQLSSTQLEGYVQEVLPR